MIAGLMRTLPPLLLLAACGAPQTRVAASADSMPVDSVPAAPPAVAALSAPGCAPVPGEDTASSTPAFVEFTGDLERGDLEWLCAEGLAIVEVFPETRSVNVRIPVGYRGDPTRNPRVRRIETRMRGGSRGVASR